MRAWPTRSATSSRAASTHRRRAPNGWSMDKADRFAELQAARATSLSERILRLLALRGDERAVDVGAGTGALAFAIAPHVREVIALDGDAALAERARADAPPNVEVVVGDAEHLPFGPMEFDLAGTIR